MGGSNFIVFIFLIFLQFLDSCFPLPLCTDSRAPFTSKTKLDFCSYNGTSCCSNANDLRLKNQFESMNVSDSNCAALLKSILCARCDQFSAELYRVDFNPRAVPILCNSTVSPNSTQSTQATNNFCSKIWTTCQNISVLNSPFSGSLQGQVNLKASIISNSTKLTDVWQSEKDFCDAFGGASGDGSVCFNGEPVTLNNSEIITPPSGMCLEKIANGSYLNMVAHPDGSNRAFFSSQQGKIWLATIPNEDSGETMELDESNPFIDLTDEVHFDSQFGLLGIAFHPKFVENGRFFASFNCDKAKWPDCGGRCACNSDVNCDPSKLGNDDGAQPCQYQSVISEFTVNGTSTQPSTATKARPSEVRRIFTMGLPFTAHHGGQILFGPRDGYLYFIMGDGGSSGDPYNFSQNKKSLLGKIMRFDVDTLASAEEISQLGLWGNYSIPKDNPYTIDSELQKEIWATGLRNPWRCSFDSARPSYFLCADTGQDRYEEVNVITKYGNYGWRSYEGPYVYTPLSSPGGNTSVSSISPIFPVMGYNHSDINTNEGSASITGGYFSRSMVDPCLYGRYLFADLYAGAIWAGSENPISSGNFTTNKINFTCASDSPLQCTFSPQSSLPALSYIFSFGEDNKKNLYLLTNSGVYRMVRPSRCKYMCAQERDMQAASPSTVPSAPSGAGELRGLYKSVLGMVSLMWLLLVNVV